MEAKKPQRQCQPCTACCDGWLRIVIKGVDVHPGRPCPHSTGSGCDDYENRPVHPCRHFACGWIIDNSPLPEWMKPDQAKVIVLLDKIKWQGAPVDVAIPVGREIPAASLDWLKKFSEASKRPLLYSAQPESAELGRTQLLYGWGPQAFYEQVVKWRQSGLQF